MGKLVLAIAGAPLASVQASDAYFYPYGETVIDHGKPEAVDRGARGLTLTMTAGTAFAKPPGPPSVAGVIAVDGKTYEITATPGAPPTGSGGLGLSCPRGRAPPGGGPGRPAGGHGPGLAGRGVIPSNMMPCVFPILIHEGRRPGAAHADECAARGTRGSPF